MSKHLRQKLFLYQLTTIIGTVLALSGFSYNVWRMEVTEHNNNVRTASFEILTTLAELEQLIYQAHYDHDETSSSPRVGWVKVGLVADLSVLTDKDIETAATELKQVWAQHWSSYASQQSSVETISVSIKKMRHVIQHSLQALK